MHSALLGPATRPPHLGSRPRPGPGLSFGLIHPRPPPFTDVHSDRVRAVGGRWRTPVNAMQQCWKACWGNPSGVRISYPPPSLTRQYIKPVIGPVGLRSLIQSMHIGIKSPKGSGARFWMLSRLWPPARHSGSAQTMVWPPMLLEAPKTVRVMAVVLLAGRGGEGQPAVPPRALGRGRRGYRWAG